MLLLPLVCVVVRSAKQFRLQYTLNGLKVCSDGNDVIAGGSIFQTLAAATGTRGRQWYFLALN